MSLVVGFAPDDRDKEALQLAAMLARSASDRLLVCTVVPAPWTPGPARVDAEYQAYLGQLAQAALEQARAGLPSDVPASFVEHRARSAPIGLIEVAERHGASMIVLGSSTAGVFGRVALGSVTNHLLHSSPVPLALATRGFRCESEARVRRVTAAFGSDDGDDLVVAAAGVAAQMGAALRVASFAVRPATILTAGVGTRAEEGVVREWLDGVEQAQREALEQVTALASAPAALDTAVGRGSNWDDALEDLPWEDGDILAVGSSVEGLARVFLGSNATKIVRHSPVPVVVVPRGAIGELADQAEQTPRA